MSHEQIKGTLFAVGATAASTALLVGGIVGYNHAQSTAAADEQALIFNEAHSANGATDALTGATGEFSDHCTVMREGVRFTVGPMSYTTSNTSLRGTPVPPTRSATGFDWQWTNKTRISPTGVSAEVPDVIGTTPQNVATPDGRTQANLNAWYQQIWDSNFKVGSVQIGYPGSTTPATPQVLAAHCEWDVTLSSNADTNSEGSTLNDDVTLDAVPVWDLAEGETAPWLTVDGEKAQVSVHGRAYHTADQPVKGNDIPADAQLIGETTLNFTEAGTKTATINKPSNLDEGYVTWVWSVEKNNQPEEWGKYLINTTVSDGWATENEVVELPKAPKPTPTPTASSASDTVEPSPAPSVTNPAIEPSESPTPGTTQPSPTPSENPTPGVVTPSPEPSVTTSTPAPSTTTATPSQNPSPSTTPNTTSSNTPNTDDNQSGTKTPKTHTGLAHTGSMTVPLIGASGVLLAAGLTIALKKRDTI